MNFEQALRSAGLRPRDIVPDGRIRRCATDGKPGKRNGWYVLHADRRGLWGDWTSGTSNALGHWKDEYATPRAPDPQAQARMRAQIDAERQRQRTARAAAASLARKLMSEAGLARHPYLVNKGFLDLHGLVLTRGDQKLLLVPMRIEGRLVGAQLIDEDGAKKFLTGQKTKGATYTLGHGEPVFCEGYATALSVQAALGAARMPRAVVACFSACNLQHVAKRGLVVADNDVSGTGRRVAEATGLPFWISDTEGEDFNDYAQRVGLFRSSQALKLAWMRGRECAAHPP